MGFWDAVEEVGEAVANVGKSIGQDFDDVGSLGRLIPMAGVLTQLDDAIEAGEKLADWADGAGIDRFLLAANSPVLVGAQMVIAGMRRTTGTGEPDTGEQFGRGSQWFGGASVALASAAPNDDWAGSGADAYNGQNHRQTGRTATLADLDRKVQTVIAREALQINYRRGKLDDQTNWLADVGHTTYGLGLVPGIGPALKAVAETQAVIAAVGSSSMELASLYNDVGVNASAVQGLVSQYEEVSRSTGASASMPPPPALPGGPGDDLTDRPDEDHSPRRDPTEEDPTATPPDGGGGGTPTGDTQPSVPTPQPAIPSVTPPSLPQLPTSGGSTGVSSGVPAPMMGGLPSAMGGTPATAGTGGATSALGPLIQATVHRAFEQQSAEEKAREEEQKRTEHEAKKDPEKDPEEPAEEENGNGIPDAEEGVVAESAPSAVDGGRAPVHVEFNVDPERLATPTTVTLDRDRSPVVPRTATT